MATRRSLRMVMARQSHTLGVPRLLIAVRRIQTRRPLGPRDALSVPAIGSGA